jgi:hypothetical protein
MRPSGCGSEFCILHGALYSSRLSGLPSAQGGTFATGMRCSRHRQQCEVSSVAKAKRARPKRASRYHQPTANRLFDDALSLASTLADSRKRAGADRIVELASATREFGASLDDFPQLRQYSDQAADGLDGLADYIAKTDIPDMLDDFAGFAKRQPVATLTLGVAAGLAFTQLVHGWPVPVKARRRSANGRGKRRGRRKTLN